MVPETGGVAKKLRNWSVGRRVFTAAQNLEGDREPRRQLAAEVQEHVPVIADPKITGYVDRIAQRLAAPARMPVPFTVKVVSGVGFPITLPGGFCYVNARLIQAAMSEAELAGAIAHQIGHLAQGREMPDAISRLAPFLGSQGWMGLCMRGVERPVIPMGTLVTQRDAESRADLLGLGYLEQAGYDPRALADFFERVPRQKHGSISRVFETWAVFPASTRSQAESMAVTRPVVLTTSEFAEVQQRVADLLAQPTVRSRKPPSLATGH